MSTATPTNHSQPHSTWAATLKTALAAAAAVAIVLLAFVWPARTSTVKDLPVDVVGSGPVAEHVKSGLTGSGAFDVASGGSRQDAVVRIEKRQSYGAVVVNDSGIEVVTASAASPVVAQMLTGAAMKLGQGGGSGAAAAPPTRFTDIVPLAKDDPRGTALGVASLPLAMGGMLGGILIALLVTGSRRRIAATAIYAAVGGGLLAGVLGPWLGILPGSVLPLWGVMGAALGATASTIVGLHALLGKAGIPIGAVLTMFVGNPLSGANSPVEFYPWHWGAVGQALVPGAASTLMREVAYFPKADTAPGWLVLAAWAVLGLLLMLVGRHRNEEVVHVEGATTD